MEIPREPGPWFPFLLLLFLVLYVVTYSVLGNMLLNFYLGKKIYSYLSKLWYIHFILLLYFIFTYLPDCHQKLNVSSNRI